MVRAAAITFVICALPSLAAERFTPDDAWNLRTATDPQISADGTRIAFVESWRTRDMEGSRVRVISSEGKEFALQPRQGFETGPCWSPDGTRLAYLVRVGGGAEIHVTRPGTAEDVSLDTAGHAPLRIAWSPDGNTIAFTARIVEKQQAPGWAPPAILPQVVTEPLARVQLFVAPASGGTARQITTGAIDFHGEPAWLADGRSIVIAGVEAGEDPLQGDEIYSIRVADGTVRRLTRHPGPDEHPVPSPDGSKIAFLGADYREQPYLPRKLYVMNADGSRVKVLSGLLDRDAAEPQWSSDSRTVYFLADDQGETRVYAARGDATLRQVKVGPGRLRGFSLADNGRAVSVRSGEGEPSEIVSFAVDSTPEPAALAALNGSWLTGRELGSVEEVSFASSGYRIQAWVTKPPDFDPARKYPLILDISDGPGAMYGAEFHLRAQILAARGFVVLCVNPRGSAGYGEQFGNLLPAGFPGDDFEDLMRGVDFLVSKGYVDESRLMVAGGLTAAWAIGHTDRFRAAVIRRPIVDWAADVATRADGRMRATFWMRALPWENPQQYVARSPLFAAGNFRTPSLIIAGEHDPESDELDFALRAKKVEAAMVRLAPDDEVKELEATLAWFMRHLNP